MSFLSREPWDPSLTSVHAPCPAWHVSRLLYGLACRRTVVGSWGGCDGTSALLSGLTWHTGAQSWASTAPSSPLAGKKLFLSATYSSAQPLWNNTQFVLCGRECLRASGIMKAQDTLRLVAAPPLPSPWPHLHASFHLLPTGQQENWLAHGAARRRTRLVGMMVGRKNETLLLAPLPGTGAGSCAHLL